MKYLRGNKTIENKLNHRIHLYVVLLLYYFAHRKGTSTSQNLLEHVSADS